MSNKLRYASPVKGLSKINLLCKQNSSRIMNDKLPYAKEIRSLIKRRKRKGQIRQSIYITEYLLCECEWLLVQKEKSEATSL